MVTQLNMPNSYSLNIDYLSDEIGCNNSQLWTWRKWSYVELGLCWDGCSPSMWLVGLQSFYVNGCYPSIETFRLLQYGCWNLFELQNTNYSNFISLSYVYPYFAIFLHTQKYQFNSQQLLNEIEGSKYIEKKLEFDFFLY